MPAHNLRIARVPHQVGHGGGEVGDVAVFGELSDCVVNDLGHTAGAGPEAGLAVGHGLEEDQAKALFAAGEREKIASGVFGTQRVVAEGAEEIHGAGDSQPEGECLQTRGVIAGADDAQAGVTISGALVLIAPQVLILL